MSWLTSLMSIVQPLVSMTISRSSRPHVQNGTRRLKQYNQNGLSIINLATSLKIQVALFAWKKQEAKSITVAGKATAVKVFCIVI